VQTFIQVQRDHVGIPLRLVGITQDITDRKTAEVALADRRDRLAVALQAGAIGSFAKRPFIERVRNVRY